MHGKHSPVISTFFSCRVDTRAQVQPPEHAFELTFSRGPSLVGNELDHRPLEPPATTPSDRQVLLLTQEPSQHPETATDKECGMKVPAGDSDQPQHETKEAQPEPGA
jgi:hypothetical protein